MKLISFRRLADRTSIILLQQEYRV